MSTSAGNTVANHLRRRLSLLESLCRANVALLDQKLGLIGALVSRHGGSGASDIFKTPSSVVGGATVGQHYRHSLDHVDRAVRTAVVAASQQQGRNSEQSLLVVAYDRRERGGADESDMEMARERILRIQRDVLSLETSGDPSHGAELADSISKTPIVAEFMLSGDSSQEYPLPSTVARELGFGVHHAIHHMAMVRVAVLYEGWLTADQIDPTFGRAPSTVNYDRTQQDLTVK